MAETVIRSEQLIGKKLTNKVVGWFSFMKKSTPKQIDTAAVQSNIESAKKEIQQLENVSPQTFAMHSAINSLTRKATKLDASHICNLAIQNQIVGNGFFVTYITTGIVVFVAKPKQYN